jgi:hypothetical protein
VPASLALEPLTDQDLELVELARSVIDANTGNVQVTVLSPAPMGCLVVV